MNNNSDKYSSLKVFENYECDGQLSFDLEGNIVCDDDIKDKKLEDELYKNLHIVKNSIDIV